MKLQLKQIAPYLPYKLKMLSTDIGIWELKPCSFMEDCTPRFGKSKPLLTPLSELTKSIDGEKSHLSIMSHEFFGFGIDYVQEPEFKIIEENGFYGYQNKIHHISFVKEDTFNGVSTYFVFFQKNQDDLWIAQKVTDQLEMFQYLFQHHFDVFGLIDAGLALDKTESL